MAQNAPLIIRGLLLDSKGSPISDVEISASIEGSYLLEGKPPQWRSNAAGVSTAVTAPTGEFLLKFSSYYRMVCGGSFLSEHAADCRGDTLISIDPGGGPRFAIVLSSDAAVIKIPSADGRAMLDYESIDFPFRLSAAVLRSSEVQVLQIIIMRLHDPAAQQSNGADRPQSAACEGREAPAAGSS